MPVFYPIVIALAVLTTGSLWSPLAGQMPVGEDKVVATVDGFEIRMSDVDGARPNLPPQATGYPKKVVTNFLITTLIDARLAAVEARRQGIDQDPAVKRRIERTVEQLLQNALLKKVMKQKLGEKQLREAYRKMLKDAPSGDEVRARHILVKTEKEALAVVKRAQKGEGFAKLAQELSTGPSGKSGGDLGYFTAERMVPAFSAAAFATRPGEITVTPVKTQFGWHVIKVEDRRKISPPSFKEARPQLQQKLAPKIREDFHAVLRANAKVEKFGMAEMPGK